MVKPKSPRRSKRLALLRRDGPIHDLPDDVIRQCLLRVPYKSHSNLRAVCRKWKDIVSGPAFYKDRLTSGTSDHLICMIQYFEHSIRRTKYQRRIIVFDPRRRTWAMLRPIPDFPFGVSLHCKCVCVNGKLVLIGGLHPTEMNSMSRVYIFDFVSAKWRRGADMLIPRTDFACSVSSTIGLIYVAGGRQNQNDLLAAEVYNVDEDKWEILPPMSQALGNCHGVFLAEKLFVFGQNGNNAEIYDPKTGVWRRVDDMWRFVRSFRWSSLVASGQLFTFNERQLMKYDAEENDWVVETVIPTKFCGYGCTAEWRDHIFFNKLCNCFRRQVCCLLNLSTHEFIEIEVPAKFRGVATAAEKFRAIATAAATVEI